MGVDVDTVSPPFDANESPLDAGRRTDSGFNSEYVNALEPLWGNGYRCTGCHFIFLRSPDSSGAIALSDDAWRKLVGKGPRDGLSPSAPGTSLPGNENKPCQDRVYVVPGQPSQSYLLDKLLGRPQIAGNCFAGEHMPQGCQLRGDCLTAAELEPLENWIRDGAPLF